MDLKQGEVVLCEFYFSNAKQAKKRPVLVFKDNLPFDDFIGIPISSKDINHQDELALNNHDFEAGSLPKPSKLIIRKTFVISKQVVIKHYGQINSEKMNDITNAFCRYFECLNSNVD